MSVVSFRRIPNPKSSGLLTNPLKEEGTGTHGLKVHVWGGISAMGAVRLEIFKDSLTAKKLINIMRNRLTQLNQMHPNGFIWQQDNSGMHRSDKVSKFIDKNMPQSLIWPSYSPDLSPIENVWKWLKGEVAKDSLKTLRSLKQSIRRHWNRMSQEFLESFINSMPDRRANLKQNN